MANNKHPIIIQDEKFGPMFAFAEEVRIGKTVQATTIKEQIMQMADRLLSAINTVGCDWYSTELQRHMDIHDVYEALVTAFDKQD